MGAVAVRKLLCILLSVCLLLPASGLISAAGEAPAAYAEEGFDNPYPLVVVRGMDFTDGLRYHAGKEDERVVNVMSNLSAKGVLTALGRAAAAFVTRGEDGAVDEIITFAASLFEGYACDENGDSLDPEISSVYYEGNASGCRDAWENAASQEEALVRSAVDRYGVENVYFFNYDWRLDTFENAGKLSEMIGTALEDHGTDKVDLVCCSMGGILTLTYLNYYGSEHIDSLVSDSATMYGTDVTTDLLLGKVYFDTDAVLRFLQMKFPQIGGLAKFLYKTKILERVCGFLNRFAEKYKDKIYAGVLTPVFGSMPAIWELVQYDSYEDCKAYIFGNSNAYAGLRAKTDRVQNEVCANMREILDAAMENGMKFGVLTAYNTPNAPAYEHAALQGDGTLETRMMSFGALVSEVGGALSDGELAVGEKKYVSADKCINASTALYRDMTWFVKDTSHVGCVYHSDYTYLIFSILETESQPTVETWEKYPQFMQAGEGESLSPLTDAPGKWDK